MSTPKREHPRPYEHPEDAVGPTPGKAEGRVHPGEPEREEVGATPSQAEGDLETALANEAAAELS